MPNDGYVSTFTSKRGGENRGYDTDDTPDISKIVDPVPVQSIPGASFGEEPLPARPLDRGMGIAVGRRTVFRTDDENCFGKVADRVSLGNISLLDNPHSDEAKLEQARLRNAIATGALLTSGRHLQHGDASQPMRNIEVFSNCSSAITSFAKFYLLLNGSGVGRSYDDSLMAVNWQKAPRVLLYLSPEHPDFPHSVESQCRFGISMNILPDRSTSDPEGIVSRYISEQFVTDLTKIPQDAIYHQIADSREGWAKALEILEAMAFRGEADKTVLLDFSIVRPAGSPIAGMQNRPASGPVSLMRVFLNLRNDIINYPNPMPLWEQAIRVDHYVSIEVQVGGARRAARMATKNWHDPDILSFIRIKSEGGLWTANHSVMVDSTFWSLVQEPLTNKPLSQHAHTVFREATRCAYINGEPGFINGDALEDHRTGTAWLKPVYTDGRDFCSMRYKVDEAVDLLADLSYRASVSNFPVTTNPCGEIALHVTGGYCVIADYAPLLACPVPFETLSPGVIPEDIAALWDARIEDSVRLGVRFLQRANTMDSLYGAEVDRTNRMGIGPTGIHEYAWMRYGYSFEDLIDPNRSAPFWSALERYSNAAKDEANTYAEQLGRNTPFTVTTLKPAGTTSKLFGLTEGAHLPARQHYLRWVQFKGTRDPDTDEWHLGSDPLLAEYSRRGYPLRELVSFPGMTIVGFPTVPLLVRLNLGHLCVTASEASPESQYQWIRLLEKHWIGASQGNQISYTMKIYTDRYNIDDFRDIVRQHQPTVRCCAILPSKPDHELGFEYTPEEELTLDRFVDVVSRIDDNQIHEDVDLVHLQCMSGVCPL